MYPKPSDGGVEVSVDDLTGALKNKEDSPPEQLDRLMNSISNLGTVMRPNETRAEKRRSKNKKRKRGRGYTKSRIVRGRKGRRR